MKIEVTENEIAALAILKSSGVAVMEAAQLAYTALKANHGRVTHALKCFTAGKEALQQQKRTVSFEKAVEAALAARQGRRIRTLYDFRYFTKRFMTRCPGLSRRHVRSISPAECAEYIEAAFDTPRQRQKARLILSGVFSTAVKRGWCSCNPVAQVEVPRVQETPVPILTPQEIGQIISVSQKYHGGECAAAVGMMLYAGIRPHEVVRLRWEQVDLREQAIYISSRHSKTGGARRVSIHKPLLQILRLHRHADESTICPPNWLYHWRKLRLEAGWKPSVHPWRQDALRHTFASYHLSYFRSYTELQCEMGHRDASLLRTRYVDQRGVVNAWAFWNKAYPKPRSFRIS